MIVDRLAQNLLKKNLQVNKVVLLYGPRRVGKTTLLNQFVAGQADKKSIKMVTGENRATQDELSSQSIEILKGFVGDKKIIIVDEAQKIPNIGLNLKLIVDNIPDAAVIASGSASFSLAKQVGEPLTGRKKTINLFPISASEIIATKDLSFYKETLESYLIFGGYPELFQISNPQEKRNYLLELIDSYLFKDILELENVRSPKKIRDLLTLLAFQIGKEVSLSELANVLEINKNTVYRYLDLLEKSFIIINVRGFSRNLRKEVSKTSRYYFYDNGVRNGLINNFNILSLRDDIGMLWENYLVMERIKKQSYQFLPANNYFWRTYDQKEIDWVEERDGYLYGYEICWSKKAKKAPKDWLETYPKASYETVDKTNFLKFIL
ncbi:ATP-binding protein [Patescibacteria group bacterium]|nr:ATP-binding protein [Patescibacteria group bacterium]MBU4512878.1 ATP-binding protein [Patescibacteria group bacterium]